MARIESVADADKGLEQAKGSPKLALLSFPAPPDCAGCTKLDDKVYAEEEVVRFIMNALFP
jgi:hypothetical protein